MAVVNYIFNNYVMLFELIGMLIMLRISAHISLTTKRLTVAVVVLLLTISVIYSLERWVGNFEQYTLARPMLTACVYSLYPIVLILLMQITAVDDHRFTKDQMILLVIPEVVCVPLFFTTQWTGFVCHYTENNHWSPGPLRFLPYGLFGLYCLILLIRNFYYFRHYTRENRLVFYYILFLPVVGVIGFLLLDVSDDYSTLFTSCVLLYYLYIYIHMARIDSLTSLYNRQSFYQDMRILDDRITGVASIDMNELKYLNDNMGHEEGDRALVAVSRVLRKGCGSDGIPFRIGGDEFIILYTGANEQKIDGLVELMRQELAKTPYTCAFGVAIKQPGEVLSTVIRRADDRMYINKAEMKREAEEKGVPLHMRD